MLKNAILPLKTPFSGTLKMNNQYLTVARPQALNEEERESGRLLDEKGIGGVLTVKPGARVRKKINDSLKQIRARTEGKLPGMLVLYDQGRVAGHIDPYNIKTAMYGLEQVHFAVQRDPSKSPYAAGMSHGPGQKMTENDNTSISAIAALWMSDASNIHLHVYHNTYAVVPLEPTVLASFPVVQYLPTTCEVGNTRDWVKYEP